ncbi:FAD-binding oxidoreductase [Mesobaculum littorinae]|uniref:FAD-binding oxidoreductase n=1 Tax=Mesobaculum littorinae TaxID=2486419 RepID=A0A438AIF6_9RHOB|nr:FAD-binding oxidoreductase [Mesobaculum littorinae]RVV98543.1 FAD-binding oxidoreductase [Mesobaculum littorinae]
MTQDLTPDLSDALARLLPADTLRPAEPRYLEEPRGKWRGRAAMLALPRNTDEVATILRFAHDHAVPVIPYGGGTGLVGGQLTGAGAPIVVSVERMTQVRAVYPDENVMVVEAGAVLADVQAAAAEGGRLFPLSLASEGSARIGGLLATNAGGVNVLRYGNARDLCLGLEAVLPDGQVMHGLRRLRKDNTGYDLKNLLIGAEGTLGLITAASLKLVPQPARRGVALIVVDSPEAALRLLTRTQALAGPGLSAFELISGQGLRFIEETQTPARQPFETIPGWMALIDLGLPASLDPDALLEEVFAWAFEEGVASDGVIAQSDQQRQDLWTLRESIPDANRKIGAIASHDISVPISLIPGFLARADAALDGFDVRINAFGHLGDGNLHYNAFPAPGRTRDAYDAAQISRVVHDLVHDFEGAFSAEHGVGRLKVADLERYGDPARLAAMRAIKAALDPRGIMNPGAVLRLPDAPIDGAPADDAPADDAPADDAPADDAPADDAPADDAPADDAPADDAPADDAPADDAPADDAPADDAPADDAPADDAPADDAPADDAPADDAPADDAPADDAPADDAPADDAPADDAPADDAPADDAPADDAPADDAPADDAPADDAPADDAPADDAPADDAPADDAPADDAPADDAPADDAPADDAPSDDAPSDDAPTAVAPTEGAPATPDHPEGDRHDPPTT